MNISIFLLCIIIMICFILGMFDANNYRIALADDINSGKLTLTQSARKMIAEGDKFMKNRGWYNNYKNKWTACESDLFCAFIAKVWFERARLEMEMNEKNN